jgi:hypothetical protein
MSTISEKLRDLGMDRARKANDRDDPHWRTDTLKLLKRAADDNEYVDPDLLRKLGAREPLHPNAWGSIWKKGVKEGLIKEAPNMRRKSERPPAHAKKMTVYKSLQYL